MIIKHYLFKDKTFTEKEFKKIIEDILEDEYFNKVINLLSISLKSEYEIIKYIHTNEAKNKTYLKDNQIDNIINKLKQFNYIDDNKLSISLIDYYTTLLQSFPPRLLFSFSLSFSSPKTNI